MPLRHCQAWGTGHLSRKSSMFEPPLVKKILPNVHSKPPLTQLWAVPIQPYIFGYKGEGISISLPLHFLSSESCREQWGHPLSLLFEQLPSGFHFTITHPSKSSHRSVLLQLAPSWPWLFHHPDTILSLSAVVQLPVSICGGPYAKVHVWPLGYEMAFPQVFPTGGIICWKVVTDAPQVSLNHWQTVAWDICKMKKIMSW